jgi:RNA polymerase sigma-70 factor (ECF subfamily)
MSEPPRAPEDREIIEQVLAGEVNAFEILLRRYEAYVMAIVHRYVPSEAVEEVAQEVFIQTFKSLPTFIGEHPFKNWLAQIAVRACHTHWRKMYRRREVLANNPDEDVRSWLERVSSGISEANFEAEASRRETKEIIHWALGRLSPTNRMVLTMVHLEGRPVRETAELLGLSAANVKVRAHRARKELRKHIQELLDGEGAER